MKKIMEINTEIRKKQLENLEQFISSSRNKVQSILSSLHWSSENVKEETNLVTCHLDSNHKLPFKAFDEHISKCFLRKEQYSSNEDFLSFPTHPPGQYIVIDNEKKNEIFLNLSNSKENFKRAWNGEDPDPKTSNRLLSTFSSDERLALYDYAVNATAGPSSLPEFNINDPQPIEGSKDISNEELLAMERDAKRRRIKYKSVYTNHKSHSEVLKEVIETQMELYEDWLKKKSSASNDDNSKHNLEQRISSPTSSHVSLEKDVNDRSTVSRNSTHSDNSKSTNRERRYDNHSKNGKNSSSKKSDNEEEYKDSYRDTRYKHSRKRDSYTGRYREDRNYYKDYDKKYRPREKRNGYKTYH